jgi:glycosyltransferase involved in cell wall biosynthesis
MRKPVLTIFYQFDPWSSSLGGIQTTIRSFVKYAPETFDIQLVGIEDDPRQSIGTWREAELCGRALRFIPLFVQENDNFGSFVPVTIKYTAALMGKKFTSDFMHFHRLEPTIASRSWTSDKTLFIHNDIQKQMDSRDNKKAILWRRIPSVYFALERMVMNQFTEVLSCNTSSAEFYRQQYPSISNRVRYLRNTVDEEVFFPFSPHEREENRIALTKKLGLSEETRFILFAGRLQAQKDPLLLVQSIAKVNFPNAHLLIVGEGDLGEAVRTEVGRLGISSQVTMVGAIPQVELAHLQRLCSIFVLTSAYEGLPLVALEALACGTPVVTTRAGETPKLLRPGSGLVCEECTPESVAASLEQILTQPEAYPEEACLHSSEPFSARSVVHEVYSHMMQRWEFRTSSQFSHV